jgi:hypothetical protein
MQVAVAAMIITATRRMIMGTTMNTIMGTITATARRIPASRRDA